MDLPYDRPAPGRICAMTQRGDKPRLPTFFSAVCRHYAGLVATLDPKTTHGLQAFCRWACGQPRRWNLMTQGALSAAWRRQILQDFQKEHPWIDGSATGEQSDSAQRQDPQTRASREALAVIEVLFDHGRLALLPDILMCVESDRSHRLPVYLQVAKALEGQDFQRLEKALQSWLGRDICLRQTVTPEVRFGGVCVWGSRSVDLSLSRLVRAIRPLSGTGP